MNILAVAAIGFVVTLLSMLALRPIARSIDLVDRPGGRKMHDGDVPLVGGLAMFFGIVAGLGLLDPPIPSGGLLMAVFAILVVVGLLDDRFAVSPWARLAVHFVAALALILGTNTVAAQLGNPFGIGELSLHGPAAVAFTALLVAGAINAFNMLDGMDGLAGTTALTSIGGLAWLMVLKGDHGEEIAVSAVACGVTVGFLLFNAPVSVVGRMRCFMGDAGSTLLGALVAWLCVRTSQYPVAGHVNPVTVLWIVAVPLYEMLWTIVRRALRRRSPLSPDNEHFHYMLRHAGLSVRGAFLVFAALNVILLSAGLVLQTLHLPDVVSFGLWLVFGAATVHTMYRAPALVALLPGRPAWLRSSRNSAAN